MTNQQTEQLRSKSLSSLYKAGVFQGISRLRYSKENNYPFVSLICTKGDKTSVFNAFFGQKTAQLVNDNFQKGDSVTQLLKNADVIMTKNKENELRFKISASENSQYVSKSELQDIWGESDTEETFDLSLFKAEFKVEEVVAVPSQS